MDKKNAITYESILNQHTIRVYTDGSKLDGRVGAGFYAEYKKLPKTSIFPPSNTRTAFQAEVLAIFEVTKNLLFEKCTINVLLCW